jgi:hypothetical protein
MSAVALSIAMSPSFTCMPKNAVFWPTAGQIAPSPDPVCASDEKQRSLLAP